MLSQWFCILTASNHRNCKTLHAFLMSSYYVTGVLMWEVFTCGKMPYGRLKNTKVVECVQKGIVLERPKACFKEVYDVSDSYFVY